MQILIIEDEKRLADALGQIMQEARYQADIVYDGRDGLAYASSGDYDVIVLDVMLPGMDGFEVVSFHILLGFTLNNAIVISLGLVLYSTSNG